MTNRTVRPQSVNAGWIDMGHAPMGIGVLWVATILGDDLYCHQPMCERILAAGCHFLLTCKPESHPTLYEWLEGLELSGGIGRLIIL